jgi:hypothetical protein
MKVISPLQEPQQQSLFDKVMSFMTPIVSPLPGKQQSALGQAIENFAESKRKQIQKAIKNFNTNSTYKVSFITPTPTPKKSVAIPSPTPSRIPSPTLYPTPSLTSNQISFGNQLQASAQAVGIKTPQLASAIGFNESSLNTNPTPNITNVERTFGPAGINLLAHPQITQQQAEDVGFAKNFLINRIASAQKIFPNNIERQILYYNVPRNAYLNPNDLSYQAAWYLQNALRFMGKTPSSEYLPILQKYGFFVTPKIVK